MLKDSMEGALVDAKEVAHALAEVFCRKGALEIIREIRSTNNL